MPAVSSNSVLLGGGYRALRVRLSVVILGLCTMFACGCPSTTALPTQAPVLEQTEPRTEYAYLLYVPSTYSDDYRWPLVVACHGTWPYDTARLQMREWARFGEDKGIIVAAPTLVGTKGDFPPSPEKQIALQRRDEEAILAIVSELKRGYTIAEDQVFMTGWSAGAYAILHTGLRNPDVFRAMTVRQGSFDERYADIPADRLDPWQRILVIYGTADFLREKSMEMLEWLRGNGMHPEPKEITGTHRRIDPALPWRFFKDVVKKTPWLRVRARPADPARPLAFRFNLDAVPKAARQKWFFGDGEESYEASPVHAYEKPGRYKVTVNAELEGGKVYARRRIIEVRPY